jgi:hypothetical protein
MEQVFAWRCLICATIACLGAPSVVLGETGAASAARATGEQRQEAAAGWLRLDRQQSEARAAAPRTPEASRSLGTIQQAERLRYRGLLDRQREELAAERRASRRDSVVNGGTPYPAADARLRGRLTDQRRQQEALRLRMRTERRIGPMR